MSTATQAPADALESLAIGYLAGGLSLVPCDHNTKRPDNRLLPKAADGKPTWKTYQDTPADEATVRTWFRRGCKSIAVIGGKVSGGLLILDFDEAGFYDKWVAEVGLLAQGLPVQQTGRKGGGGYQVALRCPNPGHNDKLAWVADEKEETGRRIAIETRGEGGYAVLPGSLHPSGNYYRTISGDWSAIPVVDQERADAILEAARSLDQAPLTRQEQARLQTTATESTKHRSEANGQTSVIDAYNQAVTIEQALEAAGYHRAGRRWARPGGTSATVEVKDGRSIHYSTDDPLNDRYWHRAFDLFCYWKHNGDCKAAVRAAAEILGIPIHRDPGVNLDPLLASLGIGSEKPSGNDKPENGQANREPPAFTKLLTGAELLALDLKPRFLVRGIMVDGQPMILGGRSKTLKTSIAIDLALSLGSGTPFLGRFYSERTAVGFWSGESGAATIRETARRIAETKGVDLADCDVLWCFDLPRLSRLDHLDHLGETIRGQGLHVAILDPLYLALLSPETASGASNVFLMGSLLQGLTELGQRTGCTVALLHHFRKGGQPDEDNPAGLEELAQSGVAEWARQWLLLQRRTPYQADGVHCLWMRCGGSAGHASLWGVRIDEGLIDPETFAGRQWQVTVSPVADARAETERDRENRKAAELERREAEQRERLLTVLRACPEGDTAKGLREASGLNTANFGRAVRALLQEGRAIRCEVVKKGVAHEGFKPTGK